MSKLAEILSWIKKNLFHRKIDSDHLKIEDVSPETLKKVSFNEGNPGKIFGIRRDVVMKIAIGLLCFFIIGFWMAYPKAHKEKTTVNPQKEQEVANSNAANQFGDGHSKLSANLASRNAQVANGANHTLSPQQLAQQQVQQTQATRRVAANNERTSEPLPLPQMGVRGQYGQPYYSTPYPQATSVPTVPTPAANPVPEKDPYSAAISFGLGVQKSADRATVNTEAAGNSNAPAGPSYTMLTDTMLQTGTLIPAMLISGIDSDAGDGQVIAQTEADVYDSLTETNLLIPAGSRFIGTSKTADGGRVNIDWNMLVLPNGGAYTLAKSSMIAIDGAGYTGLQGNVNNHNGRTISAGVLTSAIAALGGIAAGNTNTGTTSSSYSTGQLAAQGAMSNLLNSASSIFQKGLNQTATVTVPPGYEFNIFVCQSTAF